MSSPTETFTLNPHPLAGDVQMIALYLIIVLKTRRYSISFFIDPIISFRDVQDDEQEILELEIAQTPIGLCGYFLSTRGKPLSDEFLISLDNLAESFGAVGLDKIIGPGHFSVLPFPRPIT